MINAMASLPPPQWWDGDSKWTLSLSPWGERGWGKMKGVKERVGRERKNERKKGGIVCHTSRGSSLSLGLDSPNSSLILSPLPHTDK